MYQNSVFLSLGSNLGDKRKILADAVTELGKKLSKIQCSSIYETEPLYFEPQPNFFNIVVYGKTEENCRELFKFTSEIEELSGRNRNKEIRNGPRSLDIDILLFNNICINTDDLIIPHPRMNERLFVLVPLSELNDTVEDPLKGVLYSSYIKKLSSQKITKVGKLF